MRIRRLVVCVLVAAGLAACGTIPRDPDATLEQVRTEGLLRVGASPAEGSVTLENERPVGPEADLVLAFADELGVEVSWTLGGETELVAAMERGELDLLIGGLLSDSPWADKVSLTRPYRESTELDETVKHVLAVPLGENAMLVRLERFLDEADG